MNDTALLSIYVDNSVNIGTEAGAGCTSLESIEVHGNFNVGNKAFMDCTSLKTLINTDYNSNMGNIGTSAFQNTGFVNLYLNGFREVQSNAFDSCQKLESIEVREHIYVLGNYVFQECPMLKEADLTYMHMGGYFDGSIGTYIFKNCTALETVKWAKVSLGISTGTFSGCTALKTVTIEGESNMTSICNLAFENCISLESIPYSRFLAAIDAKAFVNCESLKSVK